MSEILGLLDALESVVLESKKIPLTENIILEERKVIDLIDKIRITVNSNGNNVRKTVDINEESSNQSDDIIIDKLKPTQKESDILEEAKKIKEGASEYAEYVLTSLQLTITKMQNNLIKLEKNIESGRNIIHKQTNEKNSNEEIEKIEKK
tara:strand:- start:4166 stop:4615 length:450 start_codon:yes stop_codon:yes gene_type:complete